jgi:lipopolysaccharide export system protein LptA
LIKEKEACMPKRILNLLLAVVLFVPVSISAAPVDATQNRGPIHVTSDRLEADDEAQIVIFSGNAVATQDDVTIHADRLTIKYTGEKREITQVIADGQVRIVQQEKLATGEKAVYYNQEERVVMTGSPKVTEGDNSVEGQEITLYLNEKRSVVSGGDGGRVKAIFTPKPETKQ